MVIVSYKSLGVYAVDFDQVDFNMETIFGLSVTGLEHLAEDGPQTSKPCGRVVTTKCSPEGHHDTEQSLQYLGDLERISLGGVT